MTPDEFVALHPEARDVIALLQARIDGLETVVAEQALTIGECALAMSVVLRGPAITEFAQGAHVCARRAIQALGQEP